MNDQVRTYLFNFSALLLLGGAILYITQLFIAPYLFATGAAGMALCFFTQPYKELNIRKRRLQRFNIMAGVLMIATSALMFNDRNEWIACLTVAALFITYSTFVSSSIKDK